MQGESMADFVPPPVREELTRSAKSRATQPLSAIYDWAARWGLTDPAPRRWAAARNTPQAARRFVDNISREPMTVELRLPVLKCTQNPNPQFKAIAFAIQKVP